MLKQLTVVAAVSLVVVANFATSVSAARKFDPQTNHADYWGTTCAKTELGGNQRSYSVNGDDVSQVIVKGGPDYAVYGNAPFTNLTAPTNPNNKHSKTYAISHVIVCDDVEQPQPQTNQPQSPTTPTQPDTPKTNQTHKVTICHRTAAVTNPYRKITVASSAVDGSHGADHFGRHSGSVFSATTDYAPNQKHWGDIIPPVGDHAGLNWDAAGRAIYDNDCQPVSPSGRGGGNIVRPADVTPTETPATVVDANVSDAPQTLPNTGPSALLSLLLPAFAAVPAYPLLRKREQ